MDNIIELLVFFFVIYSIIGSIFRKKKKQQRQQQKRPVQYRERSDNKIPIPKQQQTSKDILEELFGFKTPQPETEPTSPRSQKYEENLEYKSWDPGKEFDKKVKEREGFEYRDIEKTVPDINYDKLSAFGTAKKISKNSSITYEYKTSKFSSKKTLELKSKLRNPETFRDLFIISEIINKPKALRSK